jgi:hypothetical protein
VASKIRLLVSVSRFEEWALCWPVSWIAENYPRGSQHSSRSTSIGTIRPQVSRTIASRAARGPHLQYPLPPSRSSLEDPIKARQAETAGNSVEPLQQCARRIHPLARPFSASPSPSLPNQRLICALHAQGQRTAHCHCLSLLAARNNLKSRFSGGAGHPGLVGREIQTVKT